MTITSTRHGLSVYTGADATTGAATADNRRLRRPVDEVLSNTFNDATSGHRYKHPAGHEGIDFDSDVGIEVKAMYGGVVVEIETGHSAYGTLVTIRSCTDPATGTGFEHTYAHLQSTEENLEVGDSVAKGDRIGISGTTGTNDRHLHVHLKAFGANGTVTDDDELGWETGEDPRPQAEFRCGFPHLRLPELRLLPATRRADRGEQPHPCSGADCGWTDSSLLSPRDAYAQIPVHGDTNGERGSATGRIIHGKYLACYAVLGKTQVGNTTWYRIQYEAGTATDPGIRWVSSRGTVSGYADEVTWVQVEDAPATPTGVQVLPHFATTDATTISVYSLPSTAGSDNLGSLTPGRCYAVTGRYRDPSPGVPDAERYWWQVQYGKQEDGTPQTGWVRDDKDEVWTYGGTTGVTVYTGPATNPHRQVPDLQTVDRPPGQSVPTIGTPEIQSATSTGTSVTLTWSAAPVDWDLPGGGVYHVSGYRIRWSQNPDALADGAGPSRQVHMRKTAGLATTATWTPGVQEGTLIHVRVAAYVGQFTGAAEESTGVVVGTGSLTDHTFATADREAEPIRAVDDARVADLRPSAQRLLAPHPRGPAGLAAGALRRRRHRGSPGLRDAVRLAHGRAGPGLGAPFAGAG